MADELAPVAALLTDAGRPRALAQVRRHGGRRQGHGGAGPRPAGPGREADPGATAGVDHTETVGLDEWPARARDLLAAADRVHVLRRGR